MAQTRFTCTLTRADQPACQSYARVTIMDSEDPAARGCPRHAVAALDGISAARVDGADSKGLNEHERMAGRGTQQALSFHDHQDQGAGVPGTKHGRELRMAISG
jgi:hypothetical protein